MGKEYTVQEALKLAINAEKESMDFYSKAASMTTNERAKSTFEMLAKEEAEHLASFFKYYRGDDLGTLDQVLASPPNTGSATYIALEKSVKTDTREKEAMEIALKEEKSIIEKYSVLGRDIIDPLVRAVFEKVVKETQKHYDLIESEYSHLMTMVHESDQNIYVRE